MGANQSRFQRNDRLCLEMLDRAYAIIGVFVHAALVIGRCRAAAWFGTPTPALAGHYPRIALSTEYGRECVRDLIDALLAGEYV